MVSFKFEDEYKVSMGNNILIAGVDEAGRGPLAGPVVAASVIVNNKYIIPGINDSKKLSIKKRNQLYEEIIKYYNYSVGIVSSEEIDKINILEATKKACCDAVDNLSLKPNIVLVDGNMKFSDSRFVSIIKGDTISYSIAAASIVAKITRDRIMHQLSNEFPDYNWQKNSGYGTKEHIDAIKSLGYSTYHRKTFKITI